MLATALLAALLVPHAAAQQSNDKMSVGPRTVHYRPTDAESAKWSLGGQFRMPLAEAYMFEFSVDRARYRASGVDVTATPIQATLIGLFYPDTSISPFLLFGAGLYAIKADGHYVNPHRRFGLHVGAGLELLLSSRLSIDASYRFLWTQVHRLDDPLRWIGRDFRRRAHMFTAALNYRL